MPVPVNVRGSGQRLKRVLPGMVFVADIDILDLDLDGFEISGSDLTPALPT